MIWEVFPPLFLVQHPYVNMSHFGVRLHTRCFAFISCSCSRNASTTSPKDQNFLTEKIYTTAVKPKKLAGGFNPIEKYAHQNGSSLQVRVKIKTVWNHHLEKTWKNACMKPYYLSVGNRPTYQLIKSSTYPLPSCTPNHTLRKTMKASISCLLLHWCSLMSHSKNP